MQLLLQQTRFQNLFHSGYQESRHSLQIKSGDDDGRTKSFKESSSTFVHTYWLIGLEIIAKNSTSVSGVATETEQPVRRAELYLMSDIWVKLK